MHIKKKDFFQAYLIDTPDHDRHCMLNGICQSTKGQKVFKHIPLNRILISGICRLAKPDAAIFKKLIKTHNLNPSECIVIDDRRENIQSAESCGFNTILFKDMSFAALRQSLMERGYIENPLKRRTKSTGYVIV